MKICRHQQFERRCQRIQRSQAHRRVRREFELLRAVVAALQLWEAYAAQFEV